MQHLSRTGRRLLISGLAALSIAALTVTGLFAFRGSGHGPNGTSTSPTGFALPALTAPGTGTPTTNAGLIRLADYRGHPVIVNFFASWCTECDFELPGFAKVSSELRGQVVFIGVDSLETGDPLYMPVRHGITWWPLARDVGGTDDSGLHDALGGGAFMPITAFYDADGHLLRVNVGALPEQALRQELIADYHVPITDRP